MKLRAALAAISAAGAFTFGFALPAQAALTLTAAGIADGFSLSNFLSGGSGYTFLGAANLPDGTLAVGGFSQGRIYKFNDVDGQTLANALSSVAFAGEIDMASAGGQAYGASRSSGYFRIANDLGLTAIATAPTTLPTQGLAGNPVDGHLISVSSRGLVDIDPATGAVRVIASAPSGADGVSVSPDGTIAYVALFGGAAVQGYNIATGALVFNATGLPGGPDGTAVISGGAFSGSIVVNNNDGTVGLLDPLTGIETIIASGGTRGDFASPDLSNGSLLIFEDDSVWRLSCTGCTIGGPPPVGGTVPEPVSLALFVAGFAGLVIARRRNTR